MESMSRRLKTPSRTPSLKKSPSFWKWNEERKPPWCNLDSVDSAVHSQPHHPAQTTSLLLLFEPIYLHLLFLVFGWLLLIMVICTINWMPFCWNILLGSHLDSTLDFWWEKKVKSYAIRNCTSVRQYSLSGFSGIFLFAVCPLVDFTEIFATLIGLKMQDYFSQQDRVHGW